MSDAGGWSITGDQISFTSSPSNRQGNYDGTVEDASPVPIVTVRLGGRSYTFRQLDPARDESSSATVTVVDERGARVAGALTVFHSSNGQVRRAYSGTSGTPLVIGTSPGTLVINVAPPSGYTFAPSQANPVNAAVTTGRQTQVTVVLRKISP